MKVKKRDGSIEAYMPEKVVVSIVKTGVPYEDARTIASSLSKRTDAQMTSAAIKEHVHSELKSRGHTASIDHWNKYDQAKHKKK
ncbi:MAG: ATP cone domain-containing protein [Candidatus Thorarchaeota archaeon]